MSATAQPILQPTQQKPLQPESTVSAPVSNPVSVQTPITPINSKRDIPPQMPITPSPMPVANVPVVPLSNQTARISTQPLPPTPLQKSVQSVQQQVHAEKNLANPAVSRPLMQSNTTGVLSSQNTLQRPLQSVQTLPQQRMPQTNIMQQNPLPLSQRPLPPLSQQPRSLQPISPQKTGVSSQPRMQQQVPQYPIPNTYPQNTTQPMRQAGLPPHPSASTPLPRQTAPLQQNRLIPQQRPPLQSMSPSTPRMPLQDRPMRPQMPLQGRPPAGQMPPRPLGAQPLMPPRPPLGKGPLPPLPVGRGAPGAMPPMMPGMFPPGMGQKEAAPPPSPTEVSSWLKTSTPEPVLSKEVKEAGVEVIKEQEPQKITEAVQQIEAEPVKEETPVVTEPVDTGRLPMSATQAQQILKKHHNTDDAVMWYATLIIRELAMIALKEQQEKKQL